MDTSDPDIRFDEQGICNHYYLYQREEGAHVLQGPAGQERLQQKVKEIKQFGRSRPYDCILGLSGGVDSTYLCLIAKQCGLRPLVVHFDNGWNSELAVCNIQNTVQRLGFDLYTYVVDWPEFRDLQRSYFKANVVDIEVLTDHGFMAVLYQQARKHKIRYVLGGMNVVTESILPSNWFYPKSDLENICGIQRRYGTIVPQKLKSYPMLSPIKRSYYDRVMRLQVVCPLNWIDYRYDNVKAAITSELGWREYGGKHYESVFTRFYQGYILPQKFKFDKRRAHLSTLICSGQITREEALAKIATSGYCSDQLSVDLPFVLKKLGFSEDEFNQYILAPRVEHSEFGSSKSLYQKLPWLKVMRPLIKLIYLPLFVLSLQSNSANMKGKIQLTAGKHSILLISPQPWDSIHVSKHNYAKALCGMGNTVYFLNPPKQEFSSRWVRLSNSQFPNLHVVDYSLGFPYWIKFKAPWLFSRLMSRLAPRISSACKQPDIVWDFDNIAQFTNLRAFPAELRIFHPVDHFGKAAVSDKFADVIFSVGQNILDSVNGEAPKYFIQHGLTDAYLNVAERELKKISEYNVKEKSRPIRVGYIGDLRINSMDRTTFRAIVEQHPQIQFEVFGPYEFMDRPLSEQNRQWQEFLQSAPNCKLHGRCSPERIASELENVDIWLVCYDVSRDINSCCNSHKILEYLATGKAVVSNRITAYDQLDLLNCPKTMDNRDLIGVFKQAISQLQVVNSPAARHKRIMYAIENSYQKHIFTIERLLNSLRHSDG